MKEETDGIKATAGTWHFIFPFLLDPGRLDESWKDKRQEEHLTWLDGLSSKFIKGHHHTRKGFLPIIPYKSLKDDVRYRRIEFEREYVIRDNNSEKDLLEVKLTRLVTIHYSGAGVMTYTIKLDNVKTLTRDEFEIIARLIPRMYGWKDKSIHKNKSYCLNDPSYSEIGKKNGKLFRTLPKKANNDIVSLEKLISKQIGLDDKESQEKNQMFLEEKEVFLEKPKDELRQPFVQIELEVDEKMYEEYFGKLWQNRPIELGGIRLNGIYQDVASLAYRFWSKNAKVSPYLIGLPGGYNPIKMMALNAKLTSFLCNGAVLNIFPQEPNNEKEALSVKYVKDFVLPSLLSMSEKVTCRVHFALILDALIDDLLKAINDAKSLEEIEEYRITFDRYRMQAGLMLEAIGQHVKAGMPGTEMASVLMEVFQAKELEDRVMRKVDLVAKLMESRGWSVRGASLGQVLAEFDKEFNKEKEK